MALMVVGGPARIREGFTQILEATQADEFIIVSDAYRAEDRLRSYEIIAQALHPDRAPVSQCIDGSGAPRS
jgi:alkanesulfonate monooxygenase SsuD/methylene tetrahydromethanopterin reductase-like flavin-dependent oxidoreductase (luciferase family)